MKLADHIERIANDPDSPDNYLVFADWLQERGDPWGKLIVLQQQQDERPGDGAIAGAIEALIKKNKWVPRVAPEVMRISWRWGFLHTVRFFDAYGSNDPAGMADELRASPMSPLVRRVDIFRQDGRTPKRANEVERLRELFPHAAIEIVHNAALGGLKTKSDRAAARYLDVSSDAWKNIEQCTSATWLECRGISELPESVGMLPLERLDIDWCDQLQSIPDSVWGIESLGHISMYDCENLGLNMGRVNHLVGRFVRAKTPRDQRIYESQLFRGGGKADRARLLAAIDSNLAVVRARAIVLLETLIEPPEPAIGEGSVVATIGRFNLDRKTIKARLQDRGATVKTKINAKTTHVLLGEAPNGKQHDIGDLPVLLERHLLARGSAEKGGDSRSALEIPSLASDLRSGDDARIVAAVATLQAAGEIPRELMAELFCVMQNTNLEKLGKGRRNAKKLFAAMAPAPLRKAVATHFKTSVLLAGETKVATRLAALGAAAGTHIDMARLARIFVEDYDMGLKLIIESGDPGELRWALERRIVERRLDISGVDLESLPDLSGFDLVEIDASANHLVTFPTELSALPTLATLNLSGNYLRRVPKNLSAFAALETLDLSLNRFQAFPRGVVTLPRLEALNLSADTWGETRITTIPPEIAQLKTLRSLDVSNGHAAVKVPDEIAELTHLERFAVTWEGSGKEPPAALRALLPNCEIV